MKLPIKGGCMCGATRYECTASPIWSVNCHCRACQKLSGGPYVTAFAVASEAFTLIKGETLTVKRGSESGHEVGTEQCTTCGSRIYAQSAGNRAIANIFASTLDDDSEFVVISNCYVSEAAHWVEVDRSIPSFDKMPG
jgi:hypothetical protein